MRLAMCTNWDVQTNRRNEPEFLDFSVDCPNCGEETDYCTDVESEIDAIETGSVIDFECAFCGKEFVVHLA